MFILAGCASNFHFNFCKNIFMTMQQKCMVTVKPGQSLCPSIKIWFCCSKFESNLRTNFSTLNRKTDCSSQASISIIKFASITEQ